MSYRLTFQKGRQRHCTTFYSKPNIKLTIFPLLNPWLTSYSRRHSISFQSSSVWSRKIYSMEVWPSCRITFVLEPDIAQWHWFYDTHYLWIEPFGRIASQEPDCTAEGEKTHDVQPCDMTAAVLFSTRPAAVSLMTKIPRSLKGGEQAENHHQPFCWLESQGCVRAWDFFVAPIGESAAYYPSAFQHLQFATSNFLSPLKKAICNHLIDLYGMFFMFRSMFLLCTFPYF